MINWLLCPEEVLRLLIIRYWSRSLRPTHVKTMSSQPAFARIERPLPTIVLVVLCTLLLLPIRDLHGAESSKSSPAKTYEAVTSYMNGMKGKQRLGKRDTPPEKHYRAPEITPQHRKNARYHEVLERELSAAARKMRHHEYDLAVNSLGRALAAAEHVKAEDKAREAEKMLEEARLKMASVSDGRKPAAGESVSSIGMKLVLIPSGTFVMGSSSSEARRVENEWNVDRRDLEREMPAHTVRISKPFLIGKYEVTIGEFKQFTAETGYRTEAEKQGWGWVFSETDNHWKKRQGASWRDPGYKTDDDYPVTLICHEDAEAFCEWLSRKEGRQYRLPAEAEWEYAARGGKEGQRFPWGDAYPDGSKLNMADRRSPVPWADRAVDDGYARAAPVGSYEPNHYWLYGMAGNVWELCSDYFDDDIYEKRKDDTTVDPTGPRRAKERSVRGGSWGFGAGPARIAARFGMPSDRCTDLNGFRVVAEASETDLAHQRALRMSDTDKPNAQIDVKAFLARIKELAARGQRPEARREIEAWLESPDKRAKLSQSALQALETALEALVDVTPTGATESFTNTLGMKMVRIPAGAFFMGSSEADIAYAMTTLAMGLPVSLENEYPAHKVRISRPFYLSSTEVTVGQFRQFVKETGYVTDAELSGGGQWFNEEEARFEILEDSSWKNPGWDVKDFEPVTMVSYNDALAFIDWLTAKEKLPYTLPTEAQWEYAARGGIPAAQFPWGDELPDGEKANFADSSTEFAWRDRLVDDGHKYVAPVGSYEPNGYGLYDMAGNVLEWTRDYYGEDYYRNTPEIDPEGPGHGELRVTKGGEWTFGAVNLRCAFRGWSRPELSFFNTGFRVAIDFANSRRPYHFSEDFLTKAWTPGPDQREVASAVAREINRRPKTDPGAGKSGASTLNVPNRPAVQGIRILNVMPRSDGQRAGLEPGDVIIEYDGAKDLTTDKFLTLTGRTRKERIKPTMVVIRNGYEYTIRVSPGYLGITIMNTRVRGPFKKPKDKKDRDRKKDERKDLNWTSVPTPFLCVSSGHGGTLIVEPSQDHSFHAGTEVHGTRHGKAIHDFEAVPPIGHNSGFLKDT